MNGSNAAVLRAIRGPVLLIAFGSLLSLDHFGGLSFSRTWPVLFIVLGALILIERMAAPPPAVPPPYAGPVYHNAAPPPPQPPAAAPNPPRPPEVNPRIPPGGAL